METPLKYTLLGMRLLARTQIASDAPHERRETVIPIGDGITTDIYLAPAARRKKHPARGLILFMHGMAPRGHRDPRVVHLSSILASLGYITVVPLLEEVQRQEIKRETVHQAVEIIKVLARDEALCPSGKLGLLGPSFSGALALVAAAQPEVARLISALCLIGAPGELVSALDFFMGREDADPYGYLIILKNFLHLSVGRRPKLIEAFSIAAEDDGLNRKDGERRLPAFLESIPAHDRELFEELIRSNDARQEHWLAMREKLARELDGLLPVSLVPNIRGNMTLIHGSDDRVIAPGESELIYEEMRRHGIPGRLLITPLISHGDHSFSLKMIPNAFELASVFGNFLRWV